MGTLFHLCMERLDFAAPQDARGLLRRAASEMELPDTADLDGLQRQLAEMLERFRAHELWGRLASARQTFRELDFVMDCGPAELRGQIDLLYADEAGAWGVVDYKSDRVDERDLAEHAEGYELQLLLYAAAAARHLGARPANATVYFLRPGIAHPFEISAESLSAAESRASRLAERLIRARRSRSFRPSRGEQCPGAPTTRCAGGCARRERPGRAAAAKDIGRAHSAVLYSMGHRHHLSPNGSYRMVGSWCFIWCESCFCWWS